MPVIANRNTEIVPVMRPGAEPQPSPADIAEADHFIRSNSFGDAEALMRAATRAGTRSQQRNLTPRELMLENRIRNLEEQKARSEAAGKKTWKQFLKDSYKNNKRRLQLAQDFASIGLIAVSPGLAASTRAAAIISASIGSVTRCLTGPETKE